MGTSFAGNTFEVSYNNFLPQLQLPVPKGELDSSSQVAPAVRASQGALPVKWFSPLVIWIASNEAACFIFNRRC